MPARVMGKIRDKVTTKYKQLEGRYGPRYAKAIIGAALVGLPVPLPGASMALAAPVVALAELHRLVSHRTHNKLVDNAEMTEEEIKKAAEELLKDLQSEFVTNDRWRFNNDPEKVKAFQEWLKQQLASLVVGKTEQELWEIYTREGFKKGAGRAFDDVKPMAAVVGEKALDFYAGTKDQFLRSAFGRPESVDKVKLLAGRSFDDLKNITTDMSTRMSRVLVDGLVQGQNPREIGRTLAKEVDLGQARAQVVARTEIIRAHAEGQLNAMEDLGVETVGVAVEWVTAQDDGVCELCEPMEGVVLKLDEARGMIPRHPNCRCAWIPANVGEDDDGQKDTRGSIMGAIKTSVQREGAAKGDEWGPGRGITRERPESILDNMIALENAFCPTGPGGGIDDSCSPNGGGGGDGHQLEPTGWKRVDSERRGASGHDEVKVGVNQPEDMIKVSITSEKESRGYGKGLLYKGNLYTWPESESEATHHGSVAKALGLPPGRLGQEGYEHVLLHYKPGGKLIIRTRGHTSGTELLKSRFPDSVVTDNSLMFNSLVLRNDRR